MRENEIRFKDFGKYEDNYWALLVRYTFRTYYPLQFEGYHYVRHESSNSLSRNDSTHFARLMVEMEALHIFRELVYLRGIMEMSEPDLLKDFMKIQCILFAVSLIIFHWNKLK